MSAKRPFGVSTNLFQGRRLQRDHLIDIAAHGFETVEVAAAIGHFDAENPAAVADLQQWLAEARLTLHAIAAPAPDGPQPWNAGALGPVEHALYIARRIPVSLLVLPVGSPKSAARAVERLAELAEPLGVAIAIDSRSPSMKPVQTLVSFVERCDVRVGIALDFETAAQSTALVDAIETASEHLLVARVPADRGWITPEVMTTLQKVGYDGPFIIEARGPSALTRAKEAREQIERASRGRAS
ncbi:MAG TPA: TIM barrel protein [Vicinamibacterales bacterium]